MAQYPHTARDGKWMVVLEIIDPKDNAMRGGTQFLFDSEEECISFTMYMSSPAGAKVKEDALAWNRAIAKYRTPQG